VAERESGRYDHRIMIRVTLPAAHQLVRMPGQVSWSHRLQSEPACNGRFGQQSSKSINHAPPHLAVQR
jgi:hypothetical protein